MAKRTILTTGGMPSADYQNSITRRPMGSPYFCLAAIGLPLEFSRSVLNG
jgi:hypothetical protein